MKNLYNDYQTIIAFKDQAVLNGYFNEFAEYVNDAVLLTTVEAVAELLDIHGFVECDANVFCHKTECDLAHYRRTISIKMVYNLPDALVFSVTKPKFLNYRLYDYNWYYPEHLITSASDNIYCSTVSDNKYQLDDELCPMDYAISESIEHKQEDREHVSSDDLTFSYRCGYYDAERFAVVDGDLINRDDVVTLHNGDLCHIGDAVWCESLDEWHQHRDCTLLENGEFAPDDQVVLTNRGYYLTDSDEVVRCDGCNEYFYYEDTYYHEHNNEQYCEDCYSEQGEGLEHRKSYSSDVLDCCNFGEHQNKINGKGVYIGFELETLCDESYISELDDEIYCMNRADDGDEYNYAIATEDGSLDSKRGCEFIFRPDSIEGHSASLDHFMDNFASYLEKDAGNGYGLHVHISSHFLTKQDKIKIQNFTSIYDDVFRMIGGRHETTYQRKKVITKNGDLKYGNAERYGTVNMLPLNTIEFRFPKSVVCKDHIIKNLMLGYAIVMFCKFNLSYAKIMHCETYLAFIEYCENLGFNLLADSLKENKLYLDLISQDQ